MLCLLVAALGLHAGPAAAASVLTDVRADKDGYRLVLDWPAPYKAFRLTDPERLVVDLKDTLPATAAKTAPGSGPVLRVRVAPYSLEPSGTRVVFDLGGPAAFKAAAAPDGVAVSFEAAPREPEAPADFKDALAPLAHPIPPPPFLNKPVPAAPAAARLVSVEAFSDRAVLRLTRDAEPDIFLAAAPPRLVIDLPGVLHGAPRVAAPPPQGGILLGARSGAFRSGVTRVVLDPARPAPYSVEHAAAAIIVTFTADPPPAAPPASKTREFRGWIVGPDSRPLEGVFLVRFSVAEQGSLDGRRWEESLYVDARGGRFSAVLGRFAPLPADALAPGFPVDAAAPPGVSYRVVPR